MYHFIKRTILRELLPISVVLGSLFLLSLVTRYMLLPYWQSGTEERKKVTRYKALISGRSEYEELKKEIRRKQTVLEKKHMSLTQGLADPHDLSGLLQMIFDKAWESDIQFDKTIPQQEKIGKDYIHYPVLLEMQTTYNSLVKFIASLERIPQIVSVDRVAMTAIHGQRIQGVVLITCYLNTKDMNETDSSSQKQ